MQIIQSKTNFIEKVIRDNEGRLVRARFAVYENAGRIKARLVDFVYLDVKEIAGKVFALFGFVKNSFNKFKVLNFTELIIHYSLFNIHSLGSKPRAPTFA
ncbi:MAG: hypothetical protein ABL899_02425 [Nitrospira sp.]